MKTFKRMNRLIIRIIGTSLLISSPVVLAIEKVKLRVHHFVPATSYYITEIMKPWEKNIEEASGGRIEIDQFYSMSLGGKAPQLMDQVRDGVVDIALTSGGYTPGRFPRNDVFNLPFIMRGIVPTSLAYWEFAKQDLQDNEFKQVKLLTGWVHGPGVIHSDKAINKIADVKGLKIRGPNRIINSYLKNLGAITLGLPFASIPEAISKGVIDGVVTPWEAVPLIKLNELVTNHIEFTSEQSLYTGAWIMVMNAEKFSSMPRDLQAIIMAESDEKMAAFAALKAENEMNPARNTAQKNNIVSIDNEDVKPWKEAADIVYKNWIADMKKQNIDGQSLIERANSLIEKYNKVQQ